MRSVPTAISLFILLVGCGRSQTSGLVKLAVLPANVLVPDASQSWFESAAPLVLMQDLATSHRYVPVLASDDSAALLAGAQKTLRMTLQRGNGVWQVHASITSLQNQQIEVNQDANGTDANIIPVLDHLAKALDADAGPFSTQDQTALGLYTQAVSSAGQQRADLLNQAVRENPSFGLAHLLLMETLAPAGEAATREVLTRAAGYREQFTALDRARLDVALKRLSHADVKSQQQSLESLLAISPGDMGAFTSLADLYQGQMQYALAEQWLTRALALSPRSVDLLRRRASLEFAQARFADAEKTLLSLGGANVPYLDVAACRLLEGNLKGAAQAYDQFGLTSQPFLPLSRASWLAGIGQVTQATAFLEKNLPNYPAIRSLAFSQLAVWYTAEKQPDKAASAVQQALPLADGTPLALRVAQTALAIVQSATNENQFRQTLALLPEAQRDEVLGFALLINGRYEEATPVWEKLAERGDLAARVLWAGCLVRTGKQDGVVKTGAPLLMPNFSGGDLFSFILFPEMLRVRAEFERRTGQAKMADQFQKLVQMYAR